MSILKTYVLMKKYTLLSTTLIFLWLAPQITLASTKKPPRKSYIAKIYTKFGSIHLLLFDDTPLHRDNFVKLIDEQFYDSTIFHRVLENFMIQGGDPNSKPNAKGSIGRGNPGYSIQAEINDKYKHDKGMLAAARLGDNVNPKKESSGSQFYIVQNNEGAHHLDNNYTIFGKVLKGLEVVDEIAQQEVKQGGRPLEDIRVTMTVSHIKRKKIKKIYNILFEK